MMDFLLAIDQGTTGTTCVLIDTNFEVKAKSNVPFDQLFPFPGWVEHNPKVIWQSVCDAIENVLGAANISSHSIQAIGITNQRETSVIWDRETGEPIHNAVVWQDRRTANICEQLKQRGVEKQVINTTGLVIDPYFSATKMSWILDSVSNARSRACDGELAAGTIDSYLLWKLTGGKHHKTDPSNACRTSLWSIRENKWSESMGELFDVPLHILPEVKPSAGLFGVTEGVECLADGIPICGMIGDQQSALFAQGCFHKGQGKCTLGTGAFVMVNSGNEPVMSQHGLLCSVGWQFRDRIVYCLEGSSFMAGAVVQWLRDGLGLITMSEEIEVLASTVNSSDGVVLVPGHTGLGAPYWRPNARGIITGLTRGTTKGHIARAALEGIALQIGDLLGAIQADMGQGITQLKVDGGAAENNLLMQIQADVLDIPLLRGVSLETTAIGAAIMAGIGAGIWSDTLQIETIWKQERRFDPATDREYVNRLIAGWREAVSKA